MYSFYRPATGHAEAARVSTVIETGRLSTGELVADFEQAFADFAGTDEAIAVSSGSIALELALDVSPLESGDCVIVSPFNCTAVLYALQRCSLHPVFVDIAPDTFNLDPEHIKDRLAYSDNIAGLLLSPTYGLPENLKHLIELAEVHDLTVVNDYCQAPGARIDETPASATGDVGVCSFGATKPLTTGEGGMVTTDDPGIAEAVREMRSNSGVDRQTPPTNVRMSDVEAAMGLTQLERYPDLLGRRRAVAAAYRDELPASVTLQAVPDRVTHVYHRFAIRAPDRDQLASELTDAGIETSAGITKSLATFQCVETRKPAPAVTNNLIDNYLLLPMHPGLDPVDASDIASAVTDFYE